MSGMINNKPDQQTSAQEPDYSEALKIAPKWIKDAYREFIKQPIDYRLKKPFLYFILGSGTQAYKLDKKSAKYIDSSKYADTKCSLCIFFYPQPVRKIAVCSQVRGNIDRAAVCKLFVGL